MSGGSLDPDAQILAHTIYTENAYAYACIERLGASVVRKGLRAFRGESPSTPEFDRILEQYYIPFCRDVIREVLVYGIVSWDTADVEGNVRVPFVVPGHTVRYSFEHPPKSARAVVSGVYGATGAKIAYVSVWETPDFAARTICSAMMRCAQMHRFESQLMTNALEADRKIASTPLVLENTAAQSGFWALRNYQPFAAQPRTFHNFDPEAAAGEHFQQNFGDPVQRVDERLMALQDSYVQKLNTIGSVESMEFSRTQGQQHTDVPRMQLPPHTHAANVSFSQTRGDLVGIMGINLDRICAALGVPRTLFQSQGTHQSEGALLRSQRQFDEITRIYRPFLNALLTEALRACTAADDFLMGVVTGDARFTVQPHLEVHVGGIEVPELLDLYKAGIIERDFVRKQLEIEYGICLSVDPREPSPCAEDGAAGAAADDGGGGDGAQAVGAGKEQ
jgi:hypothetical protein